MPASQKTLDALAKGRAVQAQRRAALKAANAEKVAIVRQIGISHLGEVWEPLDPLLAELSELSEQTGSHDDG